MRAHHQTIRPSDVNGRRVIKMPVVHPPSSPTLLWVFSFIFLFSVSHHKQPLDVKQCFAQGPLSCDRRHELEKTCGETRVQCFLQSPQGRGKRKSVQLSHVTRALLVKTSDNNARGQAAPSHVFIGEAASNIDLALQQQHQWEVCTWDLQLGCAS